MTFPHSESQVCVNACDPECGKCHIGVGMNGRTGLSYSSDRLNPGQAGERRRRCHEHRTRLVTGRGSHGPWAEAVSAASAVSTVLGVFAWGIATILAISLASAAASVVGAFQPTACRESSGEVPDRRRCGRVLRFCGRFGIAVREPASCTDHRRICGDWSGRRCVAHTCGGCPAIRQGVPARRIRISPDRR